MKNIAFKLCLLSFLLAFCVVVLGAFTRLADAGLGCPDWPTCYGHLWVPLSEADVATANENFQHAPVEHDKTWPEQLHRIFASTLGLCILGLFFLCYKRRNTDQAWNSVVVLLGLLVGSTVARIFVGHAIDWWLGIVIVLYFANLIRIFNKVEDKETPFKLPSLLAGCVVLQGLFGMWTVTLNLWPQVVTAHLLGGFTILSLLWLAVQNFGRWHWRAEAEHVVVFMNLKRFALISMILVFAQIALGGWVSSNYAALACPDFPLCQNQIWPSANFSEGFNFAQHVGPNYLGGIMNSEGRIAIHLTHRIGAIVVTIALIFFGIRLLKSGYDRARNMAFVMFAILLVQLSLGVSNIIFSLPLTIAVAHNAVGALLLLALVTINHRIRTVETI